MLDAKSLNQNMLMGIDSVHAGLSPSPRPPWQTSADIGVVEAGTFTTIYFPLFNKQKRQRSAGGSDGLLSG